MAEGGISPKYRPVIDVVADAAGHALTLWAGGKTEVERWEKLPGQPVCQADMDVNAMLHGTLAEIDPRAGWLSEETADNARRLGGSRAWVIDPIDGTRDYIRGRSGWCVSVALVEHGRPILGVLAAPVRNELWLAEAGRGATLNGRPIHASDRTSLAGARVPADHLSEPDRDLVIVPKPNSIALRMAMVAAGEADLLATIRWGNEWDIAAAALIAEEAGATVTDALGAPFIFNQPHPHALGVLCTAPGIHAQAVERLRERAEAARRE